MSPKIFKKRCPQIRSFGVCGVRARGDWPDVRSASRVVVFLGVSRVGNNNPVLQEDPDGKLTPPTCPLMPPI